VANYIYTFNNFDGDVYQVDFIDRNSEAIPLVLHPLDDGFNLKWSGTTDETYKPIITSSCTFNVWRDTNSLTMLAEISSMVMGTFEVLITRLTAYAGSGSEIEGSIWWGYVLQDSLHLVNSRILNTQISLQVIHMLLLLLNGWLLSCLKCH
jgi:hypothetical protein